MAENEVERKQNALRQAFLRDGILAPNLLPIEAAEKSYGSFLAQFGGFDLVSHCSHSFLLESLSLAEAQAPSLPKGGKWEWYAPLILFFVNVFSRLRAAERTFRGGYPLEGFALLRDVKDRAAFLAAILLGITSLRELLGIPEDIRPLKSDPWLLKEALLKARRKEHQSVLDKLRGSSSGLPEAVQTDLKRWELLFNEEVHLSLHTYPASCISFLALGLQTPMVWGFEVAFRSIARPH